MDARRTTSRKQRRVPAPAPEDVVSLLARTVRQVEA
ncbi:MAG: hypothetical protein QOC66_2010, partial [Pseudonocardiales bacterium]|nr:hypothetical protein [Pseudonocardiales bacterium]